MWASAAAAAYSAAIDTQSDSSAAPQPASGSHADARTSASRLNQAPPSPGMLRLRRSWSQHGRVPNRPWRRRLAEVVWTNDLPRRQASRDARVALSRWACWCSGWAPADPGQWMRPDLVTIGSSIRGERDGSPREEACRPHNPPTTHPESPGVTPHPLQKAHPHPPRFLVCLGGTPYAPPGAPVKERSERSAWAVPPSARDPDLSPLVVHRHTHYLSDFGRRVLLRRAQPEVIQDPADRETIDDVRHDLERTSTLAALEWIGPSALRAGAAVLSAPLPRARFAQYA